jgi:hypothetical protein
VLLSKRCPHTGVVNFFETAEPHIAIGSITRRAAPHDQTAFAWRVYCADMIRAGVTQDPQSAERALRAVASKARATNLDCNGLAA